jgi:transcription initiation factor IIF auxiliary subunit
VDFHLHESFAQAVRTVLAPGPFEVHETGWGEFEVKMVLHFVDPDEEPVSLVHMLRLHPDLGRPATAAPVVAEMTDDIVFLKSSETMAVALAFDAGFEQGLAQPHPLLGEDLVMKQANEDNYEAERRQLEEVKKILKQRAFKAKRDFDALQNEATQLSERLENV